jgi:ABC-type antimicrobial peptide transport system permease subunit
MSWVVNDRVKEIGIRMALGAGPAEVLCMILGTGMRLAIVGIVIGIVGAGILCRALYDFLVGVKPIDPATYIVVSTILLGVALFSAWAPARRATRVDPMVALRAE